MNSKFNPNEREWVGLVKEQPCSVCGQEAPSDAHHIEEELRWGLVSAQARIDVWRSNEASNRVMDKAAQ